MRRALKKLVFIGFATVFGSFKNGFAKAGGLWGLRCQLPNDCGNLVSRRVVRLQQGSQRAVKIWRRSLYTGYWEYVGSKTLERLEECPDCEGHVVGGVRRNSCGSFPKADIYPLSGW